VNATANPDTAAIDISDDADENGRFHPWNRHVA
jgi:hypothetical protein